MFESIPKHRRSASARLAICDKAATFSAIMAKNDPAAFGADDPSLTIGFVLIPEFPLMAYAAAIEPLRAANQLSGKTLYRWWHASPDDRPVSASNVLAFYRM